MKRYQIIAAWIFIALSIMHTAVGFISNKSISENVFWFFTGGMALFYVGVINLIQTKNLNDKFTGTLTVISNLVMTIFVVSFGIYNLQKNLGDVPSWLLMLNSVTILFLSIRNKSTERISS
jgi:surface polysaccharide O-acyltransferase-like enzyme